jgi:Carboxypeptidase regulatory-like domain
MRHRLLYFAVIALLLANSANACECSGPRAACTYVSYADAIFIGTVAYSNDDGSGTFRQITLLRFTVEESFKGLPDGAREVWIDPGSLTSCYADYHVGDRMLVFASKLRGMPFGASMMSVAPGGASIPKPLPPGVDPKNPPTVYSAPECSGSRVIDSSNEKEIARDIEFLRRFKAGDHRTFVAGRVISDSELGGTYLPGVAGADVSVVGNKVRLSVKSGADGLFSTGDVPPGTYVASATFPGYAARPWEVRVPEVGCGSVDLDLIGKGVLGGRVEHGDGTGAAGVKITLLRLGADGRPIELASKNVESDANGNFTFDDLPAGKFQLGVNLSEFPGPEVPYARTTWSSKGETTISLDAGEHRQIEPLALPRIRAVRKITVHVAWPDGKPAKGASVEAEGDAQTAEPGGRSNLAAFEEVKAAGDVTIELLDGFDYEVDARVWNDAGENRGVSRSRVFHVAAGSQPIHLDLTLDQHSKEWNTDSDAPTAAPKN